jgi:hypothetical protein
MLTEFLSENLNGRDHLEYLGIHRSIILKLILKKECVRMWHRLLWLRIDSRGGSL